jgi:ABC-2 type transport system permease protein
MIKQIWLKELKAGLYTWKSALWLVVTAILFSFISYLLLTNKELSLLDQTEMLWLFSKIIISTGFLIVAIDACSIITSEFEGETAESLFLSPLKLKDFILGKLLASLTLWWLIFIVAVPYILVMSSGTSLSFTFMGYVFLLGTMGILGFVFFVFAVSLIYRSVKNTLTTSLIVLLVLTIPALFSSTLKNNSLATFLSKINPVENIFNSLDNVLVDFQLKISQNLQFIIPVMIFVLITLGFLICGAVIFKKRGVMHQDV